MPASFYGIVLGLGGLANAWRAAYAAWPVPQLVGEVIFAIAALAWAIVSTLFGLKWILEPEKARAEAHHPVQCCFIGLSGVSTLVIAQGALPYSRTLSVMLFVIGTAMTLGFGLWRTGLLWQGGRDVEATTPVLYLPTVAGGFVTAATASAFGSPDWGALAFGAALFSWLAIESVLLHRLYTAVTLPPALRPTLGIQIAPPAVGAVAYLAIGGPDTELVAYVLLGYAMLQGLLLLRLWSWIGEQPFTPSYWAFSFGVTALPIGFLKLPTTAESQAVLFLAPITFLLANVFVAVLALKTIMLGRVALGGFIRVADKRDWA